MVLRMKNFNIFGVHWKIWLLGGGLRKTDIEGGGLPKNGGLGQFADLRGGAWQERGGGVFERGWYPNAHYEPVYHNRTLPVIVVLLQSKLILHRVKN